MTTLLERVGRRIDANCCVTGEGCKVVMTGAPTSRLVIDFDKPGSPLATATTRCDYLLVAEDGQAPLWVAVLELKRGQWHAGKVVRQLRAGASAKEQSVHHGHSSTWHL